MQIIKKIFFYIIPLALLTQINAQQDALYTQYMYNMSVINPAYATTQEEVMNFGLLYRSQWVGLVGAPTTGTFFAHSKLTDRVEGGLSIVHDQIGDVVKDTNVFFDFSYVVPVSSKANLSFGLKAGLSFFSTDFNGFVYSDPLPDPAFAENLNQIFPNVGAGLFYFTDRFYLGFSTPNLLQSKHLEDDSGIVTEGVEAIHYFLTSGYVFHINESLKFKPAFMARAVQGAPLNIEITANMLLYDKIEFGLAYRLEDSVSGLFNFKIAENLRLGYAYDHTLSNLGRFNSGSHEVMLLFNISRASGYDKSPRFF